jgi:transposase InsO family protein
VEHVTTELGISERRACRALGQHRSTQRKIPTTPDDEAALTADIIELARQYGRYGYRRITALLRTGGWTVNKKRVERISTRARRQLAVRLVYPLSSCPHSDLYPPKEIPGDSTVIGQGSERNDSGEGDYTKQLSPNNLCYNQPDS